jgi:hypothetical protein
MSRKFRKLAKDEKPRVGNVVKTPYGDIGGIVKKDNGRSLVQYSSPTNPPGTAWESDWFNDSSLRVEENQ